MQIGEFARICNTKISVLRHYDKEGLLEPDYVDNFTGYRYYSKEQISVFNRITALKKASFSLSEIKEVLVLNKSNEHILSLFRIKRKELTQIMENLREAEEMILMEREKMKVTFYEKDNRLYVKSCFCDVNEQNQIRNDIERAIFESGYQRISTYVTIKDAYTNKIYLSCEVIKLSDKVVNFNEEINIGFENDETVIGKWLTVGEYAVKEDFYTDICPSNYEKRKIYFLPNGTKYWCYGWSKNKLICYFGDASFVNDYSIENYNGNKYMFVEFKSYEYL